MEDARCGIVVEPESPSLLAKALLDLCALDEESRNAMGANGRRYAEAHYDVDKLARVFEANLRLD